MIIKFIEENKSEICETILRSLPKWFGIESAILDYSRDVKSRPMLIVEYENVVVGFLSLTFHNSFTAEIHVMGILAEFHRKGIGQELVIAAERFLVKQGYRFLTVKTLSEARPDENYDKTRNFYYRCGFLPVEEFKTLWGEHNPCLLLIKSLL